MTEKTPEPVAIPRDRDIEMMADFDGEQTPTSRAIGTCWRCWLVKPVTIVSPAPGSSHEAMRFMTCIESRDGRWAFCALRMVLRLAEFELYVGPDRRVAKLLPPLGERRGRPPAPPRNDGDPR